MLSQMYHLKLKAQDYYQKKVDNFLVENRSSFYNKLSFLWLGSSLLFLLLFFFEELLTVGLLTFLKTAKIQDEE